MPRRSSGRSASRPAPRPAPARSPPPQPAQHAPPPAPAQSGSGGSLLGGIGSTIAQGMAFGTGSAVAHRAVDAVMGPRTIQHETVVSEAAAAPANSFTGSDACSIHSKAFQDCLNSYGNEISKCQFYMDMLSEVQEELWINVGCLNLCLICCFYNAMSALAFTSVSLLLMMMMKLNSLQ
ncbi:hypothetical protein GOBAR_DD17310 [Gossypium barbadense]|nr:hypothetical protein GOBAR_DD17310 [Gossypium barbadense]